MTSNPKILIVSEDEMLRTTIKEMICNVYDLILTDTIAQSLNILEHASTIACFLIDENLPMHSDPVYLKQIKKIQPKISIILISGYRSPLSDKDARSQGIFAQVTKPYNGPKLIKIIQSTPLMQGV